METREAAGGRAEQARAGVALLLLALGAGLGLAGALVLGAALLARPITPLGLAALGVVELLAALLIWRIRARVLVYFDESHLFGELERLDARLREREATWAAVPAAAAVWDSAGTPLFTTSAWRTLGLAADHPPDEPELVVGEPPRVFVVEEVHQPSGLRVTVLREVTRERQALQAKDELLAIVGHEMRTPLSSIKGYGQMMSRQLATLQEQVQRMDQLIGDVLDTAGANTGRLSLRREPLSVRDVVQAAAERFAASHPARALDTRHHADALIEGDAARLSQILDNLLSNAAKYSPADSPITLSTSLDSEWVRIAVRDRGRGVAAEHLPRLFDRFYRVPGGDAAAPRGFGLGLSIVRDLVEAHGGRVEARSEGPGSGSIFIVSLPVALALQVR